MLLLRKASCIVKRHGQESCLNRSMNRSCFRISRYFDVSCVRARATSTVQSDEQSLIASVKQSLVYKNIINSVLPIDSCLCERRSPGGA